MLRRTHSCGQLRKADTGTEVVLAGWVNNYRDHGGVIFIDLRDRDGISQLVFRPEHPDAHQTADRLRHEDVVAAKGTVSERAPGMANPKLPTGEIEVECHTVELLNKAETPPFVPDQAGKVSEDQRLRRRYLDLRRPEMQRILRTRHRVTKIMRDYVDAHGFDEVETPFLCRSTPEGARDFLVPARLHPGSFYALPQSPQLFKQILMASGVDKYVQIVRCFRDEDPRADRQAEFTQLDLEMSFVEPDDVMDVVEGLVQRLWGQILGVEIPRIRRLPYDEAIHRYGTDRPDLRYGMELVDVSEIAAETGFRVFQSALAAGGLVKAIRVPAGAAMTRKQTDDLAEWVKQFGAGGLPVTKVDGGSLTTGIAKFLEPVREALFDRLAVEDGDLLCFGVSDRPEVVHRVLGELRSRLANDLGMIPADAWEWLWVVDFPLVEWNRDEQRWDSLHHPFTAPADEDVDHVETDPSTVKSKAYDLVVNGSELGGGSVRIHRPDIQDRVFHLLGIGEEEARAKFGFLLEALRYGAPPHGGIALGLDRIVMHLCGTSNIRDVIAFPKTQTGADLLTSAPAPVADRQLQELGLRPR